MKKTTMTAALCALLVGAIPGAALAQATAASGAAVSEQSEPAFELLERGDSPRRELRYQLDARIERAEIDDSSKQTMLMNGNPTPGSARDETVIADVEIKAPENGIAKIVITGEPQGPAEGWLADGDSYIAYVNGFGHVTGIEVTGAERSDSNLDNVRSLTVRLPEEAVGVGAKWTETRVIEESGIHAELVYTRTITKISGDVIEIKTEGDATFSHNGDPLPGMPPNVSIESFTGTGDLNGTATIDLGYLLPSRTTEEGEISLDMSMSMAPGQTMSLGQQIQATKSTKRVSAEG